MKVTNEQEIVLSDVSTYPVRHLPIIKEYANKLGIVDTINHLVPSEMDIDPGTIFLGLILDTLSGRSPLYRLKDFFETQDRELLLGKEVNPDVFSDHNVGRVLDKAYDIGTMKIFSEISRGAVSVFDVKTNHVSFDTTSVSVFGEYESSESEDSPFKITHGYSKDHRPDLKQFLISHLCVDRNIPIFGKTEDGNGSDKTINNEILSSISKHMSKHGLEEGSYIYIADSAMVTEDNLKSVGQNLFITRLPATYKECSRVIKEAVLADDWNDIGVLAITKSTKNRPAASYKSYENNVELYGKSYRAVVLHSSAHDKRRQKRIDRELESERKEMESELKKQTKKEFFCIADALQAKKEIEETKSKYYTITAKLEENPKYKRGRLPKNGIREIKEMRYKIESVLEEKEDEVKMLKEEAGCFVLLTNVPNDGENSYNSRSIIKAYKDQHGIEQNFGFLKNPTIVNGIFLKSPERIEVLGLVLLISLLIWRLIEHTMRQYIEKSGTTLPGWDNKRTERPTSFMMLTKFMGIMSIKIGNKRGLSKPLSNDQLEYLIALKLKFDIFVNPGKT